MTKTLFIVTFCVSGFAHAAVDTQSQQVSAPQSIDFESLGENQVLVERARALMPEQNIEIVQNRIVNRRKRFEIAPEFMGSFGGDTYNRSQALGVNLHYHFNSRWSVGVKADYAFNSLTPEGKAAFAIAYDEYKKDPAHPRKSYPQIDYPKTEVLALVNWYPIYGKMNLLDKGVSHFDLYVVGGAGQIELSSGATSTYTAGMGVGFWLRHNLSTRLEMRYQNYQAQYFTGPQSMNLAIASVQTGWLL